MNKYYRDCVTCNGKGYLDKTDKIDKPTLNEKEYCEDCGELGIVMTRQGQELVDFFTALGLYGAEQE